MSENGKLIVGISGKKQSGKNTAANQIIAQYINARGRYLPTALGVDTVGKLHWPAGFLLVPPEAILEAADIGLLAFADTLKEFCVNALGLTREQCYGTDADKDTMTTLRWDTLPLSIRQRHTPLPPGGAAPGTLVYGPMTAREVMQVFGTDIMRAWYPKIWVNACIRKAQAFDGPLVLITDVRFPDEVAAAQGAGGKVIRLLRAPYRQRDQHESEIALDDIPLDRFDLVVPDGLSIPGQGKYIDEAARQWFIDYGLLPATLDDVPDCRRKGK